MDRIKILVIDCQRTIFLGFLIATAKKCMGKHAHTVGLRNCWRLFLRQNLSLSLTEVFCPCLREKYIILWKFIEVKFCFYNSSSNFNFYLWNGVLLFQQPLHNHHARLLQPCKVANTLHKLPQPPDNLVTALQSYSEVATT